MGEANAPSRDEEGGAPLPAALSSYFGARFGHDFRDVRVHRGAEAERAAASAGAAAYAVGSHVVFGRGQYAPETLAGHRLIAHELAHVVQQRPGAEARGAAEAPALEQAADRAARSAAPGGGRVTVQGRARVGLAQTPRSLSTTMDPVRMSEPDLRDEIREIREWLAAHPQSSSADANLLLSVLSGLEARLALVTSGAAAWVDLAPAFNREFAAALHVFSLPGLPAPAAGSLPPGASGPELSAARLRALFTPAQRDKLADFMATRRIPERLFNGDDVGTTTAQQRLLMAAHILAIGKYRPGSFEQRVHARMCWHWVQIVHHYAGATPAGLSIAGGIRGGFDLHGGAVLGTGSQVTVFRTPKAQRVNKPHLPKDEVPGGVGPLHAGTEHFKEAEKAEAPGAKPPDIPFHRKPGLPFDRFDELQAGDWIYVYNASLSASGQHSEIFSHFTSGDLKSEKSGAQYRKAVVYSQPTFRSGGRRHTELLGDRFSPTEGVRPVTEVRRVSPDAAPATTAGAIVPGPGGKRATAVASDNEKVIQAKGKALKGAVDRARLKQWFRDRNEGFMGAVEHHVSPRQMKLIVQVNAGQDLETLVRLYQRLRTLYDNHGILDADMASAYGELNVNHAKATAKANEVRQGAVRDIGAIDTDLGTIQKDTATREQRRTALDVDPEIKRLQGDWNKLGERIKAAKTAADRDTLRAERTRKLEEITALRTKKREHAGEMGTLGKELRTLAGRRKALEARRATLGKTHDTAYDNLPFGLVHPGRSNGREDKRGTTGKLSDIQPGPDWKDLLVPAPAAPATAPKVP